jgi:hypothetical protein
MPFPWLACPCAAASCVPQTVATPATAEVEKTVEPLRQRIAELEAQLKVQN